MRKLRRPNGGGFTPPDRCIFWKTGKCSLDSRLYRVTAHPKGIPERPDYEEALMCCNHRMETEDHYGTGPSQTFVVEWALHTPHVWVDEALAT